ncbi:hypothetical protein [Micromonospora sp. CB01531]|uniref:hypothetical protein n=1 Tax=Micromonospora sp. CB01531 TaxID=1718947 RepID=UPI0018E9F488|nr:hypothetical protein [Micromonospora sp. CB01531]
MVATRIRSLLRRSSRLVWSGDAEGHLWAFVLSGIATVLATRAYLETAGYPKLGGGSLHIAHVLWGGLFMAAGLGVAVTFLGRPARAWAAVLGGVGFGLFIDEIGKFVTARTDYFYHPAAGLIYLIFAGLVLVVWWVHGRGEPSPRERTAAALQLALVGVTSGMSEAERAAATRSLEDSIDPVDVAVIRLLATVPVRETRWDAYRERAARRVRAAADRLLARRWPVVLVAVYLVVQPVATLTGAALEHAMGELARAPERGADLVVIGASLATALLGVRGALLLRNDRRRALRACHLALLVDLLLAQVFKFTVNQFAAVSALAVNLILLWVVSAEAGRMRVSDPPAASGTAGRMALAHKRRRP